MHIRVPNLATFFLILAAGAVAAATDEKTPSGKKVVMTTSWAINTDFSGYGTTVAVVSSVVTGVGAGAGAATAEVAGMYDTGKIKEFGSSDGAGADTK
uniref:Uncharacterized protein n=1 Tax=Oryza meridionalis TaxID=40149 RepID=A0A0E0E429_9ORYZ